MNIDAEVVLSGLTNTEKRAACLDKLRNLDSAISAWSHYLGQPEKPDEIMCMRHAKIRAGLWFVTEEKRWIERMLKELRE